VLAYQKLGVKRGRLHIRKAVVWPACPRLKSSWYCRSRNATP
jgi:hypothetical protein